MQIDLNCDLAESSDPKQLEVEARILTSISSVNIACGVHAGNPDLMRRTVGLARQCGVAIGAHPGFRDQENFGRRERQASVAEVEDLVAYQVGALFGIASLEGAQLQHVKPHGALYNMAARDEALADAIARAVAGIDRRFILVGLAGSKVIEAAARSGLPSAQEAFVDRAYSPDGTLVSRDLPDAVIADEQEVVTRALSLVQRRQVKDINGTPISIHAHTICVHGDTSGADRLVRTIRQVLLDAGIRIVAMGSADA